MGIIKAAGGALGGVMAEQWLEMFYCDAIGEEMLAIRGKKRMGENSANTQGENNTISDGSIIAVNEGQCAIAIEHGKVIGFFDTPGENIFHSEHTGSIFGKGGLKSIVGQTVERIGFGGDAPINQYIMYLDLREHTGNPFAFTMPLHARNLETGLDLDATVETSGMFSFRITAPLVFYKNICGLRTSEVPKKLVLPQIVAELQSAAAQALSVMCADGVAPAQLPMQIPLLTEKLQEVLTEKWAELRGFLPVSIAFDGLHLQQKDVHTFQQAERASMLKDPTMAAATLVGAEADALRTAAANPGGAGTAFAGMHFAAQAGENPFTAPAAANKPALWRCSCGNYNTANFCENCGKKRS